MYLIVCLRRQCGGFPEEGHALCLHDIVLAQGQPRASCVLYTVDYLLMQTQVLPRGLLIGIQRYQMPQLLNISEGPTQR